MVILRSIIFITKQLYYDKYSSREFWGHWNYGITTIPLIPKFCFFPLVIGIGVFVNFVKTIRNRVQTRFFSDSYLKQQG